MVLEVQLLTAKLSMSTISLQHATQSETSIIHATFFLQKYSKIANPQNLHLENLALYSENFSYCNLEICGLTNIGVSNFRVKKIPYPTLISLAFNYV